MASAKKSNAQLASPLVFTKSIKKSYLTKRTLPIPDSVYSQHKNGPLKGTLKLHLGSSAWQVQVSDGSLQEGWDAFCSENQLKENDSVYFRHNGGRNFSVEIFNNDGSVKSATPATTGKKRGRAKSFAEDEEAAEEGEPDRLVIASDKAVEIVEKLTAQLDDSHDLTFTVTKVPKADTTEVVTPAPKKPITAKKRTPAAKEKEDNTTSTPVTSSPSKNRASSGSAGKKPAPAADEKTPEPAKKRSRVAAMSAAPAKKASPAKGAKRQTPKRGRKGAASVSATQEISEENVTDTDTAQEKSKPAQEKKRKSESPKETPRKSPRKETTPRRQSAKKASPVKKSASKEPKSKGKKPVAVDEDSAAVKQARAFQSNNPHVMVVMRKSNLQPCFYLNIPAEFSKAHMPSGAVEFDMLDDTNKAWGVRWLGPPKSAFSGGWCYFAQDHKLALGDVIVMEVLPKKDNVKIHTFRGNGSDAPATPVAKAATSPTTTTVAKVTVTEEVFTAELEGNVDGNDAAVEGLALDVEKVVTAITEEPTPITVENGDARLEAAKEGSANAATPGEDEVDAEGGDGGDDGN